MNVDRLMSIFESVQSAAARVNSSSGPPRKHCPICPDDAPRITSDRLCSVCGELLEVITSPLPHPASVSSDVAGDDAVTGGWFGLLNEDLRAAIQASLQQQAPSRQISPDYLSTLGKVELDARRGLLHDVVLHVGPLAMMAVPSAFGPLPSADTPLAAPLVLGDPICGDTDISSHVLANHDTCAGKIVVLKRGKVSFFAKARAAQCSGALACVVINTADMWPFVMTDTANEAERDPLRIPVVMVSQGDGEVVEGLLTKSGQTMVDSSLRCGRFEPECSICQEEMVAGTCVLKLACRHAYHRDCVYTWLEGHNTCPLCRNEMPVNKNSKSTENRRNRTPEETHGHQPYFH